jgi:hypothetical protein
MPEKGIFHGNPATYGNQNISSMRMINGEIFM